MPEEIPNVPIEEIELENEVYDPSSTTQTYPLLEDITVADSAGPEAANRQPKALDLRTETLREHVNLLIETVNALELNLLHRDGTLVGSYMRADLSLTDAGTTVPHKVVGMADGTNAGDGVNKQQLDSLSTFLSSLQTQLTEFVRRDGTLDMQANLDLGGNQIVNLGTPINGGDAVNKAYADAALGTIQTSFVKRDGSLPMTGNLDMGSNKVVDLDLSTPTADGDGISRAYLLSVLSSIAETPPGTIAYFAGDVSVSGPPVGWLLCDGQAVSRTTYAGLFAALGTAYGPGNGSTTFNLPDFRGRTALGLDNMGGSSANVVTDPTADSLGGTLGSEDVTLSETHLPPHTHTYNDQYVAGTTGGAFIGPNVTNTTSQLDSTPRTTGAAGGGTAHTNLQPSIAMNVIVKF